MIKSQYRKTYDMHHKMRCFGSGIQTVDLRFTRKYVEFWQKVCYNEKAKYGFILITGSCVVVNMNAAIFDMDGVIFDTETVWKLAFEKANNEFGLDLDEDYRKSTCGKSEETIRTEMKKLFVNVDVDRYREYMLCYVQDSINTGAVEIKPGFFDAIKLLKDKNYKVALATSSHKSRAELLFRKKGLDLYDIFDATVFAEDVGVKSKPDPTIFLVAAKRVNESPSKCFVFEDSINGIEAAVVGGFVPIMIVDLIEPTAYCRENCQKILRSCKEIKFLVESYENN